ncbi:hypothetical protein SLH49_16725 [Cognatiyoonia sp. IB215446]|uniref:hypothetical protein n=1 Tax=Cognatiyoonia sp. IB215446 TaxID=3097355 RepID=UPI002A0D5A2B|nr:hypothetical protein [Cognatiyoonia sp. IB215446]MDX8349631.1 hypothetical protein [Cognatiyoonia sp. IB215446]
MANFHPLDTRHKANKRTDPKTDQKPWRQPYEPPVPPGAKTGPIRDSDEIERRAREKIGCEAERDALNETPLTANLFGPAALYYRIRAMLIGERARGHSPMRIALQIIAAFGLYFLVIALDGAFGINDFLTSGGGLFTAN